MVWATYYLLKLDLKIMLSFGSGTKFLMTEQALFFIHFSIRELVYSL